MQTSKEKETEVIELEVIDEKENHAHGDVENNTNAPNINDISQIKVVMNYDQQSRYPQTPYMQQRVGGQPVYQEPQNAQNMPAYRPGPQYYTQAAFPAGRNVYYPRQQNRWADDSNGMNMFNSNFEEMAIRSRFIKRVYAILSIQIFVTAGIISTCMFVPEVKEYVKRDFIGFIMASITTLVIFMVLICVQTTRRQVPLNFILLAIFTLAESYVFSVLSTHYSTFIVFTSMGLTAIVCFSLSILACFVCCDITGCAMLLCAASVLVLLFGIVAICLTIFLHMKIMFLIYAFLIAFLFSMYLIYDTQQIMGGRRIQLSEEEYICGALTLYVDIMQIFWAILTIFGFSQD